MSKKIVFSILLVLVLAIASMAMAAVATTTDIVYAAPTEFVNAYGHATEKIVATSADGKTKETLTYKTESHTWTLAYEGVTLTSETAVATSDSAHYVGYYLDTYFCEKCGYKKTEKRAEYKPHSFKKGKCEKCDYTRTYAVLNESYTESINDIIAELEAEGCTVEFDETQLMAVGVVANVAGVTEADFEGKCGTAVTQMTNAKMDWNQNSWYNAAYVTLVVTNAKGYTYDHRVYGYQRLDKKSWVYGFEADMYAKTKDVSSWYVIPGFIRTGAGNEFGTVAKYEAGEQTLSYGKAYDMKGRTWEVIGDFLFLDIAATH